MNKYVILIGHKLKRDLLSELCIAIIDYLDDNRHPYTRRAKRQVRGEEDEIT
jgi:hypothetical protein